MGSRDEELSARFGYAFDMAVTGMALVSLDDRYVRANASFRKLVGRTEEGLRGLPAIALTYGDDRAAIEEALPKVLRGELATHRGHKRYVRPDGSLVWADVAIRRVDGDDGPLGFFVESADLTAIMRARDDLAAANDRLRAVAEASSDVVLFRTMLTPELRHEYVSAGTRSITGYTPDEHYADPSLLLSSVHPEDRERLVAAIADPEANRTMTLRFVRPDGTVVWMDSSATPIRDEAGDVIGVDGIAYVASAREVEEARRSGDARFRSLVQNVSDVVLVVDADGVVEYASPAVERHTGVTASEAVGMLGRDFCHEEDKPAVQAAFQRARPGCSVPIDYRVLHRDGSVRWMDGMVTNLVEDPHVGAYVLNSRDVTERRSLHEELRRRAYVDEATGLPNRLGLRDRIAGVVASEEGDVVVPFAVLAVAIGGLASIAEVFGRSHADRLVAAVGERLSAVLPEGSTLARIAPDDLAILVRGTPTQGVTAVAGRVLAAFDEPFALESEPFQLDVCIGAAVHPGHGDDADSLLRRAERARRSAGERGAPFVIYSTRLDDTSAEHVALLGRLRAAIEAGELELHYQPKVSLGTRTVYGAEALLRWQHPALGYVPPDRFIALAEGTGLIKPLTLWVVDAAARQLYEWRREGVDLSVAVNVTPRNLQDASFPDAVATVLETWGLPPACLWLEITERAVMSDPDTAIAACRRLDDIGVRLSLDDFGTGQSSFAYVASLPVAEIKIDGRFVRDLPAGGANAGITRAIVGLAHHLDHSVTAEGVEDEATMTLLAQMECDAVQGYHVSRPLPPARFLEWLATTPWAG